MTHQERQVVEGTQKPPETVLRVQVEANSHLETGLHLPEEALS